MPFLFEGQGLALFSEYLIKSSAVLSFSLLLAYLMKKKSAGLRHLVLSVFLIGLLFLPILSSVTTGWETPFLPSWKTEQVAPVEARDIVRAHDHAFDAFGPDLKASEVSTEIGGVKMDSRSALSTFLSKLSPVLGLAVFIAWIFGSLFLFVRVVLGLRGTCKLAREGQEIQDSLWRRLLSRFLEFFSLKRKIILMRHKKTMVPLTWGVLKPVVMMPAESDSWSENQRSTALYHELSHIKRGDYLVMILASVTRAVYWFNPLSWVVLGMIKREQEKACDELVLKAGIKPSTYAENLLYIRNSVSGHWNPPATVLGAMNKSQLNDRLITILKPRFNLKEVRMKTKVLLSFLAILTVSLIGLARPGSTSDSDGGLVSSGYASMTRGIDSHEITTYMQDQGKKEQEDEVQIDIKIEEKDMDRDQDKKEQEKKLQKGVKIEDKDKDQDQDKKEQKKKIKKGVKIQDEDLDKDKDKETVTLVLTTKKDEKGAFKVVFDKDDPKKAICVTSPYAEHEKDKNVTWTIKADKIHLSDDAKKIELDEGAVVYLDQKDKDGVKVIKLDIPHIQVKKVVKDKKHGAFYVHASPHIEVRPDVHVVIDTEEYAKLIEKIKEKLTKLKAKDLTTDVKEAELEGIEESLEKLQKAFKKKYSKSAHVDVRVSPKVSHSFSISTKDIHLDHEGDHNAVTVTDDEGAFYMSYQSDLDIDKKEAYEKAIKKLKDDLPDGYSIESGFDEEEGKLFLKIIREKDAPAAREKIKKLIEQFQEELEKIKK